MDNISGRIIKARRDALNLTQKQLADAIGCSQSNIIKIEKGSIPDVQIGLKLETALDMPLENIFLSRSVEDALSGNPPEIHNELPKKKEKYPERIELAIKLMLAQDEICLDMCLTSIRKAIEVRDAEKAALPKPSESKKAEAARILNQPLINEERRSNDEPPRGNHTQDR